MILPTFAAALLLLAMLWPQLDWRSALSIERFDLELQSSDAGEIRMVDAVVVGRDEEGRPYRVSAAEAWQADASLDHVVLVSLQGEIDPGGSSRMTLSADRGDYDRQIEQLVLSGEVQLANSDGYRIRTETVIIDLQGARAYSDATVEGIGPAGLLAGNGFEILESGKVIKVFGKSRLVIRPGQGTL